MTDFFLMFILASSTRVPGYSRKIRSSIRVIECRVVWNHYAQYTFVQKKAARKAQFTLNISAHNI